MADVSGSARRLAEKSTAQARETWDKAAAAGDETIRSLERSVSTATQEVRDFQRKVLEITRANVDAVFNCAHDLLDVTTIGVHRSHRKPYA